MDEPEWARLGYGSGGSYTAICEVCGESVELDFAEDTMHRLTTASDVPGRKQGELFAYVYFWTLEKLRRECGCDRKV